MRRTFIAAVAGILVMLLLASHAGEVLELPARDAAFRLLPVRPARATAVVAIDEASLKELGPWPWPRTTLADLVDHIAAAGGRGVVLDLLLAESRPGDAQLARALHRLPAVTVAVVDERGEWLLAPPAIRAVSAAAHGSFELDGDGIVRRLASTKQSHDRALTAVAIQAAAIVKPRRVPIGQALTPAFRTAAHSIPRISAVSVLRDPTIAAQLRGRVVFIGPTALALGDRVLTPTATLPDPGVTVHAAATESLLAGDLIRPLAPLYSGAVAALLVALLLRRTSRLSRIVTAALLVATLLGGSTLLLDRMHVAVPLVTMLLAITVTFAVIEATHVFATLRAGHAAALRMETRLGMPATHAAGEVGARLDTIAHQLAANSEAEAEAKRMLAHELRTPLASMRGLAQLLGRFELSEGERYRVTSLLEQEAGKLQSMVQILLDLERVPLRHFETSSEVIDLNDVVNARIAFLAASTDRELCFSGSPGIAIRADPALVERIIDNLVGNALKYTPAPSPVDVRVAMSGSEASLEVEDHGAGIAPADRERIFTRFYRGSTAAGSQGLGLGLSLVTEIVRWHRGSISLDDAAGGGALFRVRFPLAAANVKTGGS
jgi:signal transduction histidine kinase